MSRSFLSLVMSCGVCLLATLPASPAAAEKNKWGPTNKAGSANSQGMSSSGSSNKGIVTKKFQKLNSLGGNTAGGAAGLKSQQLQLGKQKTGPLKFKEPLNLGGSNRFMNGSGPANGGMVPFTPPNFGPRGNARPALPTFDHSKITDALKNTKIKPIKPNFDLGSFGQAGNGGAGNGAGGGNANMPPSWIRDHMDQLGGRGSLADDLRDGVVIDGEVFNPPGNGNGNPGDAADPGQGGNDDGGPGDAADPNPGDNNPPGNGNPGDNNPPADNDPADPQDDDCDHDWPFPWWPPVIIGGGGPYYCPPSAGITVIEQPIVVEPYVETLPATVDLQLVDVRIVDAGDAARNRGPRYRVVFANAGTVAVGNFQVMTMASRDGTPSVALPTAAADVVALAPGEIASVDIRLPMTADLATMGALIVAVDSAAQVTETDEQNNVAILDRTKIATADVVAATKQ